MVKIKNKLRTKWSSDYFLQEIKYTSQKPRDAFSTGQVWSNCQKYTNCNLLEHKWTGAEIRTLEVQIDKKIRTLKLGKILLVLIKKECKPYQRGLGKDI